MNWEPNPKGVASVTLGKLSESLCHRPWQGGLSQGTGYMGEEGLLPLLGKLGPAVRRHLTRGSVHTREFEPCSGLRGRNPSLP